jgi:hypothetical protein
MGYAGLTLRTAVKRREEPVNRLFSRGVVTRIRLLP